MGYRVKNSSLKTKITFVLFIVTVISLFVFAFNLIYRYNEAIVQRSNKHIEENIRIMSDRIDTVFNDGILCSNYLVLNFNSIINGETKQKVTIDNQIKRELNQSILIFKGIESIVYIDKWGTMYSTDVNLFDKEKEINESLYMEQIKDVYGKTLLFDKEDTCMDYEGSENIVTMGKQVINIISGKKEGYLFLNLNVDYLSQFVANEVSYYILYDSAGNCITEDSQERVEEFLVEKIQLSNIMKNQEVNIVPHNKENYLIIGREVNTEVNTYGWKIVGVTNLNEFNISRTEIVRILVVTGSVIFLLQLMVGMIASILITKPLAKLTKGAEAFAKGDMDVSFNFKTTDEIGTLGKVFNSMIAQIKLLIEKVNDEAAKKREYELALIQEQVKPHFLYNTLDIIIILIDMNRNRDAQRVTRKLADYYKNSLSGSEEIISIEREIRIIEDYLDLQNMRYDDKFTYDIQVDDAALQTAIPKMTLQPLVENALYHGLKHKDEWGSIVISALHKGDYIEIQVSDNGVGMTEETLDKVQNLANKRNKHFGVYSVGHRLQLYYGEKCSFVIRSEYGKGTVIIIQIPAQSL